MFYNKIDAVHEKTANNISIQLNILMLTMMLNHLKHQEKLMAVSLQYGPNHLYEQHQQINH